jgi:hypothetical protein
LSTPVNLFNYFDEERDSPDAQFILAGLTSISMPLWVRLPILVSRSKQKTGNKPVFILISGECGTTLELFLKFKDISKFFYFY